MTKPESENEQIKEAAHEAAVGFLPDRSWEGTNLHRAYANALAAFGRKMVEIARRPVVGAVEVGRVAAKDAQGADGDCG